MEISLKGRWAFLGGRNKEQLIFLLKFPPTEPILTHPKYCLLQLLWPSFSCFITSISYSFSSVETKFSSSVEFSRSKDSCPCDLLKEASQEKGGEGHTGQRKPAELRAGTTSGWNSSVSHLFVPNPRVHFPDGDVKWLGTAGHSESWASHVWGEDWEKWDYMREDPAAKSSMACPGKDIGQGC